MSRAGIVATLRVWIRSLAIAPWDASALLGEIDGGVTREDFAEHLEFFGYPNLAEEMLSR